MTRSSALLDRTVAIGSESRSRAWGLTGLVVLLYVVNYADKAVLGIIAQPLARELGLKASQIGMVGCLFFLMFCIGGFFAGPLNQYLTLRWALLILAPPGPSSYSPSFSARVSRC